MALSTDIAAERNVKKRVLVLGASGYVGSHLVATLSRTDWASPVAAIRSRPAAASAFPSVDFVPYEARSTSGLEERLGNIDSVVNCVAGDATSMVMSAQHLFAALRRSPVQRVVHLSSMVVYGSATGLVGENAPITQGVDDYTRAKVASEQLAGNYARSGGDVVILRPSCIYGPGSEQWTRRIGRLLDAGRIGDLGPAGDGCCNLIYIDDMVSAIMQALVRPGLAGEAFNVSNANPETWNQYFVRLGRASGSTPIKRISSLSLAIETKVIGPTLKVAELAGRRLGVARYRLPPAISPSLASLWRHDIQLDERKADARLCFSRTPLEEGIAASAQWLNSEKFEHR